MAVSTLRREPADLDKTAETGLRIVLFGKTGCGKSATGNNILGEDRFRSEAGTASITTLCQMLSTKINGRNVHVIDTPGVYDTSRTEEDIKQEIARCLCFAVPGPHILLFVLSLRNKMTNEEMLAYRLLREIFTENISDFLIIVFTGGDQLHSKRTGKTTTIEDVLKNSAKASEEAIKAGNQPADVNEIVKDASNRYIVFNNEEENNTIRDATVARLFKLIDEVQSRNPHPGYYQDNKLKQATIYVQKEVEKIMKEKKLDRIKAWQVWESQLRQSKIIWSAGLTALIGMGGGVAIVATGGAAAVPTMMGAYAVGGGALGGGALGGSASYVTNKTCSLL